MSVNSEEKIYNDLMNEVPSQTVSGDTKQSAAALAGAESTATGQADDYKSTYNRTIKQNRRKTQMCLTSITRLRVQITAVIVTR